MLGILKCKTAFALTALTVFLLVPLVSAHAQDPTGRPSGGRSKRHKVEPKPPVVPEKLTYLLTVITDPPGCDVFVNDERRGATNSDGKLRIDKLGEGSYKVEVRKEGYISANRGFQTGADTPTLVFNLLANLDDQVKQFDALIVAGKLMGPSTPNALEFVQQLASKYPDRPEVAKVRSVLLQKLVQSAQSIANETERWREIKRKRFEQGRETASAAVSLVPDDKSAVRLEAYLSACIALREWETGAPGAADDKLLSDAGAGFEKVTTSDPKWTFAWYQLGRSRLLANDWNRAQAAFSKCLELNGSLVDAHLGIGSAYYGAGNYREAIAEYQKIIAFDNNNAAAFAGMGLAKAVSGKTRDGLRDIERASQLKPDSGIPHLNLGIVYSKSKKKKERETAVAELKTAIEKNNGALEFPNRTAQALLSELEGGKK